MAELNSDESTQDDVLLGEFFGSGGEGDEGGEPKKEPVDETYRLKVDGEDRTVSKDELIKQAQLGLSSTQRFQEAASMEKRLQAEVGMAELVRKAHRGDKDSHREMLRLLGHPIEDRPWTAEEMQNLDRMLSNPDAGTAPVTDDDAEGGRPVETRDDYGIPQPQRGPVQLKDLDPELQNALGKLIQQGHKTRRTEIWETLDGLLDKDKVLGTMISKHGNDPKLKRVREHAQKYVRESVLLTGEPVSPELLESALQDARSFAQDIGAMKDGRLTADQVLIPSLGEGPSGDSTLTLPKEPVKLPHITDPRYAELCTQRLGQYYADEMEKGAE